MLGYRKNEQLNKSMPDFRVKLGFGLHQGWAIEGALGSQYKIDASYLSQHVFIPQVLEELTKRYKTPYLFSGAIYARVKNKLLLRAIRQVDRIKVKESSSPMDIFTFDFRPLKRKSDPFRQTGVEFQ